jgi:hypothetical protein
MLPFALFGAAAPNLPINHPKPLSPHPHYPTKNNTKIACPIIFDARIPRNLSLPSFDSTSTSPFNPDYVKGENTSWSSILLLPSVPPSRFDAPRLHKAVEVTIDDRSLFRAGANLQTGFRRAGLLLWDDANDAGADRSDGGVVSFHWSVRQDGRRGLNLSHEYVYGGFGWEWRWRWGVRWDMWADDVCVCVQVYECVA